MSNYHRSQSRDQPQVRGWLVWCSDTRSILALATPLIASQCAQSGILFIDMLLMGRLGPQAIAGGALALSAFYLCYILAFGIVSASGNLVAIAHGAGRGREVIASIRGGILLSIFLSLGMGTLLWHSAPVMLALGQDPNTVNTAQRFLRILVWGMPFGLLFLTLRGFSAGIGRAGPVPLIMFSALMLSGGLGWWLSKTHGVYGIAVASACTYAYMGGAFACVICLHPAYRRYPVFAGFSRLDLTILPSLLKIGLPSAGTLGLESSLFNASAWLMGALSTTALAAHQSVMQLVITSFTVPFGLMYAVSMRVGQAAGAGDWHKVHRLSWVGSAVTLAWSVFAISVLLLFPKQLLSLFLPDGIAHANEARDIALMLIPLAALLCLLDGWQTMASGILRALKDAQISVVVYGISCWGVGFPLACLLSRHGWGPIGIWWGMCTGFATSCLMLQICLELRTRMLINLKPAQV